MPDDAETGIVFGLKGRRAIVTGHRGGIGAAVARLFEREGAEVIGLDLPEFDLSDTATLEARAAALIARHGPMDILVNNAGVTVLGSVLETSLAEVERVFRVNFLAPYALMRAVLPGMIARGKGAIVNIASDQALIGKQASAAYGASKAAIAQLSRSAALDWAGHNIRVNAIAPGIVKTAFSRALWDNPEILGPAMLTTPLGRVAEADETAGTVVFLASDAASYISGQTIVQDGGQSA